MQFILVSSAIVMVVVVDRFFGREVSYLLEKLQDLKFAINNYKRGELLVNKLLELDAHLSLGMPSPENFEIPEYKFYSRWIYLLLGNVKRLGIAPQKFLRDVVKALKNDINFEKKSHESLTGGIYQSLVMIIISWIFVVLCRMNDLVVDSSFYLIITAAHILGIVFFLLLFKFIKNRRLKDYAILFPALYFYKSFVEIGLAISEVIQLSNVDDVFKIKNEEFKFILLRLKAVNNNFHKGLPVKQDLEQLIEDILSLQDYKFTAVNKELNAVKFVLLITFYLIPYFLYLYGITNSLM